MIVNLKLSHFEQLQRVGVSLDLVFLIETMKAEKSGSILCCEIPKMEAMCQTLMRKGYITKEYKITPAATELLEFLKKDPDATKLVKKKVSSDDFDRWWKAYPGTDTFIYSGKRFTGTRSMRVKKDDCKLKFNKILSEGEYTADELIAALQFEVLQKKDNSLKARVNKLSFMQNSLTYLNQRTFEPYIELIREGAAFKPTEQAEGGTDI